MKFRKSFSLTRSQRGQPGGFRTDRFKILVGITYVCFFLISVRAIQLHLFPSEKTSLKRMAASQYVDIAKLSPYRGNIFDRRGDTLAISVRRPSLVVNPRIFRPTERQLYNLARLLKLKVKKIRAISKKESYFHWLKRKISEETATSALGYEIDGLYAVREPARFYPAGSAAAHLIGIVGSDNEGLLGLEKHFDRDLKGQPLTVTSSKDAFGKQIFRETFGAAPEKTGNNIYLTIDRIIQEITEDELEKGVKAAKSKKGSAIVSDPHTGRILAIANYPKFDPNNTKYLSIKNTRNHALLDRFEPGSVTKPFVIAKGIDQGRITPAEMFNCENGVLRIGRRAIHDTHKADQLSTLDTIVESSNICTYKIAQRMGKELTYNALTEFGLGVGIGHLGLQGEARGYIMPHEKWRPIRFANIAFGQGFTTTAMELVLAMGTIANGGTLMKPTLIDRIKSSDDLVIAATPPKDLAKVISPETARTLRNALARVVTDKNGTGSNAATKLYTTAGKTGTAQKVDPGTRGYAHDKYLVSFLGFTPVADPHLVIYVTIDEPNKRPYYGGTWAAPVFSRIAERSLKYLNVAPDKVEEDRDIATRGKAAKTF